MTEQPRAKIWYIPLIDCSDHIWVDITTTSELPKRHYLCPACGRERIDHDSHEHDWIDITAIQYRRRH
jgi:hypothetical protein